MAVSDQLSRITPYLERLLADEYVQDQLSQGVSDLGKARKRAKGRKAQAALADRRLRSQLQGAAGALAEAFRALRTPEPPRRHRLRRVVLLAGVVGAGVYAWQGRSSGAVDS
jgi:hypothetical protein